MNKHWLYNPKQNKTQHKRVHILWYMPYIHGNKTQKQNTVQYKCVHILRYVPCIHVHGNTT